jgi:hypothetical protein
MPETGHVPTCRVEVIDEERAGKNVRQQQAVTARSFRYHEDERRMFSEAFEHFY